MLPREYACCFHGDRRQRRHGCPLPFRDVQCGRIQCRGGRERPLLGTHAEILTTTFNHSSLVCRGTFLHLADDVSDPATVAQGTACGPGKVGAPPSQGCNQPLQLRHKEDTQVCVCVCVCVSQACLDQKCTEARVFGVDDCRSKCHHHGVSGLSSAHSSPGGF